MGTEQPTSNTCAECGGPFGSHYGDCRIATGMKPKPTSKTKWICATHRASNSRHVHTDECWEMTSDCDIGRQDET